MSIYHIDFETFSRCDLAKAGAAAYAEDETTVPLLLAIAKDDADPRLWVHESCHHLLPSDPGADEWVEELRQLKKGDTVSAWNILFEYFILKEKMGIDILPRYWLDTQLLATIAGYPASLDKACQMMPDGGEIKMSEGKALINSLSKPVTAGKRKGERRIDWEGNEAPVESFRQFGEYCTQDVRTERAIHRRLQELTPTGTTWLAMAVNMAMNIKGAPIDQTALRHALLLERDAKKVIKQTFQVMCGGGISPSQTAKALEFFSTHGYPYDNLQRATLEKFLEESPNDLLANLARLRLEYSNAAPQKLTRIEKMMCRDGTVKGMFAFMGAAQTGRWSSKGVQLQNLKRPPADLNTDEFFRKVSEGGLDFSRHELKTSFLSNLGGCIRHFFSGPLLMADYSSVEARITAWLAGEEKMLTAFRDGIDPYKLMASQVYEVHYGDVDDEQRFMGKQLVLGAGFGMGSEGFAAAAGVDIETAQFAITRYRRSSRRTVQFWNNLYEAAHLTVRCRLDAWHKVCPMGHGVSVAYRFREIGGDKFLQARLPSGRTLQYLRPQFDERQKLTFFAKSRTSVAYYRKSIWRGLLTENVVQAVAADLMMNGLVNAVRAGFDVRMLIHDEAVAWGDGDIDEFCKCLCDLPDWAEGLPLGAEGKKSKYYSK